MAEFNKIKEKFHKKFEMKGPGELQYFLDIQMTRDRTTRRIHMISQTGYINTILEWFGMNASQ